MFLLSINIQFMGSKCKMLLLDSSQFFLLVVSVLQMTSNKYSLQLILKPSLWVTCKGHAKCFIIDMYFLYVALDNSSCVSCGWDKSEDWNWNKLWCMQKLEKNMNICRSKCAHQLFFKIKHALKITLQHLHLFSCFTLHHILFTRFIDGLQTDVKLSIDL